MLFSLLTIPQLISFGISVAGDQNVPPKLEIVDSLWPAALPKTKGPRVVLLVADRLYKPHLFKTLRAARSPRRFCGRNPPQTCHEQRKSPNFEISTFEPEHPDLNQAQTFSTEKLQSSRAQEMNPQYFVSLLTIPQPVSFGISVAGCQNTTPNA